MTFFKMKNLILKSVSKYLLTEPSHCQDVMMAFGLSSCQVNVSQSAVAVTPRRCVCSLLDDSNGSQGNEDQQREEGGDPGKAAAYFNSSHYSRWQNCLLLKFYPLPLCCLPSTISYLRSELADVVPCRPRSPLEPGCKAPT